MRAHGRSPAGVARLAVVTGLLVAVVVGCGGNEPDEPTSTTAAETEAPEATETETETETATGAEELIVEPVATGLEVPWDVAFTDDGTAYVTERDTGRVLRLRDDGGTEEVRTFPVADSLEGGLLGLAAEPGGDRLFAYYTTESDNRIVAFTPGQDDVEEILTGIPAGQIHNGGRIAFGPDGMLYVGTGDAGQGEIAQSPDSLGGKVLRMTPDGDVPDDNPQDGSVVLSLGHRNVQGLAWDADGTLYVSELGPDVDDEVNRIRPGANYGWPEVTGMAGDDRFVDPVAVYDPADASPSGALIPEGEGSGAWEGDLLITALRGERLLRIDLDDEGGVVDRHQLLVDELGRLRQIEQAPDGSLWLLTSNRDGRGSPTEEDDRIVRLVPPGG